MRPTSERSKKTILLWVLVLLCILAVGPHDALHDHASDLEHGLDCSFCALTLIEFAPLVLVHAPSVAGRVAHVPEPLCAAGRPRGRVAPRGPPV